MKTKVILASILAFSYSLQSQNNYYPGTTSGKVGINFSSAPTTGTMVQINVSTPEDGLMITQLGGGNNGAAGVSLKNNTSNIQWSLFGNGTGNTYGGSGNFSIYSYNHSVSPFAGYQRFVIQESTGNVGIGGTNPAMKLSVETSATNDGINVSQTNYGASALHLDNLTSGGNHWALFSAGTGNSQGSGNFSIFQYGSTDRLLINGSTGHVGIGTSSPLRRLHVETDDGGMTSNPLYYSTFTEEPSYETSYTSFTATTKYGAHSAITGYDLNDVTPATSGVLTTGIGVFGKAERTTSGWNTVAIGVFGRATGTSQFNVGGVFFGGTSANIGQKSSSASGSDDKNKAATFGLWSTAYGSDATAGYFNGKSYAHEYYQNAESKQQSEIKPIANALDKLKQLKANTFAFKADEFSTMNLPEGQQMGLDAESMEKLFPSLVKNMSDLSGKLNKTGDQKNFKAINYIDLIPLIIAGVQEQQKVLETQAKENTDLKNLVIIQQQQINDLQTKTSNPTGVNNLNTTNDGFSMEQNIPNPFTHETTVKYNLPQQVNTAYMAVYDLTGKQVATFQVTQKGQSSITINSEKLAAGIYIYSIIADGKLMDSKRMVVEER